jgi:hypothetical protein
MGVVVGITFVGVGGKVTVSVRVAGGTEVSVEPGTGEGNGFS